MENSENENDISLNVQKLIIRTRLDMESEFQEGRKKKSILWGKALSKIKEIKPDFEMTREQISRKFLNLLTTYKRIKDRNNKSGRNATSWEFYEIFDEVYGTKHSINPPVRNLQSSLNTTDNPQDEELKPRLDDSIVSSETSFNEPRRKKRKTQTSEENDTLEFLKKEAKEDEERHKEIMELERRKIEVENSENENDISLNVQKLIIRTRLDMESEFQEGRKKKSILWGKALSKIKEIKPDFEMTREQISRKFLNLLTTYKRIKDRNNKSGRNATSWEFYEIFDEVYGTKHSINPPVRNLQSSLNTTDNPQDEELKPRLDDSIVSSETSFNEPRRKKRKTQTSEENDTLEFLKKEAKEDEERHKEIMELERRKIEVENSENENDISLNVQKLIIRTRLDMESEFQEGRKKKSILWGKALSKIKEIKPDFEMTREQIIRKFLNLLTTYKRIKDRNNKSGRNATSWEFYEIFDEVYGTKHSINPPVRNLQSSLNTTDNPQDEELKPRLNDSIVSPETSFNEPRRKKRKTQTSEENDTLEFLKKEAKKDEERHKEIMELERRKIEVDQERIKVMLDLKNILQKMVEK